MINLICYHALLKNGQEVKNIASSNIEIRNRDDILGFTITGHLPASHRVGEYKYLIGRRPIGPQRACKRGRLL